MRISSTGHLLRYGALAAAIACCVLPPHDTSTPRGDAPHVEECTIGVACPSATRDGRPLLWKTRDTTTPDNEVYWNTSFPHRFIAVVDANGGPASEAWMGVNEHGFAILNANCKDLDAEPEKSDNGLFMRDALGHCRSVSMFRALLDSTNTLRDVHASFGVIDSTGAAFIFEASRDTYWVYDARESAAGFVVRANFACNDTTGGIADRLGVERYLRSSALMTQAAAANDISCGTYMGKQVRDFADRDGIPLPVPCFECGAPDSLYGVIDTEWSICRYNSVSACVIQGVSPDPDAKEPAYLSTMWVLLGSPAVTIAAPYWPVGPAPAAADGDPTAPLCDLARAIRPEIFRHDDDKHLVHTFMLLDGHGGGLWAGLLPVEADVLATSSARLEFWRAASPDWTEMLAFEDSLSTVVLDLLANPTGVEDGDVLAGGSTPALEANRPNPFNPRTTIVFTLPAADAVGLCVHDLSGRIVRTILDGIIYGPGRHEAVWDGTDDSGRDAASGVYICRLVAGGRIRTGRMVLVR